MRLDCDTFERDGVTLVACLLTNDGDVPRRVRAANRLDGPVWYPRTGGVPARGWDDGGYEGVLEPGETRPLGYATPADASSAEPPVEIAWTERAAESDREWDRGQRSTPAAAARALPDSRPPRGAVPEPEPDLPPAVASWLSGMDRGELASAERRALAAVVRRAEAALEGDG